LPTAKAAAIIYLNAGLSARIHFQGEDMQRRDLLTASTLAGAAAWTSWSGKVSADELTREFYELRVYEMPGGTRKNVLQDYLSKAAIPAWNRQGIKPVGAFTVMSGANSQELYLLVPYPNLEAFMAAPAKLAADAEYQKAAMDYLGVSIENPAFLRYQSTLLLAFSKVPRLRLPAQTAENKSRIFELRTYESHSEKAAQKKIEMFNVGGEIDLFDRVGLKSVFFGQTLIGARLPNLVYLTVHDDMASRDKTWSLFRDDPGWKKLSADPAFANTVSAITVLFLSPAPFSQI
jgi:hypothetical protein